jgi:hypothetical protein
MKLNESILETIKVKLGLNPDYDEAFDVNLVTSINTAFERLYTLGIGPQDKPFRIEDGDSKWTDFIEAENFIDSVIDYIYFKVKLMFDLPATSFAIEAVKNQIGELEFLFLCKADELKKEETN